MTPLTLYPAEIPGVLSGRVTRIFRVLKDQDISDSSIWGVTHKRPLPLSPGEYWVRETWSGEHCFHSIKPSERPDALDLGEGAFSFRESIWYWADGDPDFGDWERPRSPVTMPRWASRASIRVTDVRVHRVWDVTEDEIVEAGVSCTRCDAVTDEPRWWTWPGACVDVPKCKTAFAALFNAINGPSAWEQNPWVVGAEIKRIEG